MSKAKKLKVYGWMDFRGECPRAKNGSTQTREICAAPSFAALARGLKAAGRSVPGPDWYSETANEAELITALSEPMTLFWVSANAAYRDDRKYTRGEKLTDPKQS